MIGTNAGAIVAAVKHHVGAGICAVTNEIGYPMRSQVSMVIGGADGKPSVPLQVASLFPLPALALWALSGFLVNKCPKPSGVGLVEAVRDRSSFSVMILVGHLKLILSVWSRLVRSLTRSCGPFSFCIVPQKG